MERGLTGSYRVTRFAGEEVRAFLPAPLPPVPPLEFETLSALLERAVAACGRLDGMVQVLPDPDLFLYAFVRKEAVLSSQIEGTQSTLDDLLLFELEELPGVPVDDVREVSNYVRALAHGVVRLDEGFPLSSRLIKEIHAILLTSGRGTEKQPGEFRRSQNWIGGTRPGNAHFVPPPPEQVPEAISQLEQFLHTEYADLPVLIKAALVHAQFQTIHPFLDGNGRAGRLLISLILYASGLLSSPILYLSLYFKQNRSLYYRLLDRTRFQGDWEAWVEFFLRGVLETAENAVAIAHRLTQLAHDDAARISQSRRASGNVLRLHQALQQRPITNVSTLASRSGLSYSSAERAIQTLVELQIARELTGRRRNRIFGYTQYLAILSEGDRPLR
jgi:Fic family protein